MDRRLRATIEISLMAAIAAGELVGAHESYGRNRPLETTA